YGVEQEYALLQKDVNWPMGWTIAGYPGPQIFIAIRSSISSLSFGTPRRQL
ncbi:Hypothetical predicted protein, partial [Olea europaea subsp. europaea]